MSGGRGWLLRFLVVGATLITTGETRAPEPTTFPPEAKDRFDRAQELRKKQQYQQAISAFEEAIKFGMQNYPRAYLYRADSARALKDYDAAIAQYTEFIQKFGIEDSCRY
jgi:tetratricopeptide (TPR) repeat protein